MIKKAESLIIDYQTQDDIGKEMIEEEIIKLYQKTMEYILRNFEKFNYYDDMKQELIISLIKAIRTYDINCSIKFSTYAVNSMRFIVCRKMRYQHLIRIPEYLKLEEYEVNIHSNWMKNRNGDDFNIYDITLSDGFPSINYDINIYTMKKQLTEKEFKVACMYYFGYKQVDISKTLKVSTSRIGQIMDSIKNKLKDKYVELV